MNVKSVDSCLPENGVKPLNDTEMVTLKQERPSTPVNLKGNWGPLIWTVEAHIDNDDLKKSYFQVNVSAYSKQIINGRLDIANPKIAVDINVFVAKGHVATYVDFNKKMVGLKGHIESKFSKKVEFDISLYSF
ncbi:hypothetical protein [Candidatus Bathycorpusculum sp.]|uniref:hypothetical protein n=1 Tax=Candidatus Bathycorpusculum sp. TaxID=2994959 RepID=UPI00282E4FD6|nr:hypothetical protein [Candidatus Termitimicrobium sp.]MCL2685557.1 hypothetical protein [Candidatus Termitimicrobium sp.]